MTTVKQTELKDTNIRHMTCLLTALRAVQQESKYGLTFNTHLDKHTMSSRVFAPGTEYSVIIDNFHRLKLIITESDRRTFSHIVTGVHLHIDMDGFAVLTMSGDNGKTMTLS